MTVQLYSLIVSIHCFPHKKWPISYICCAKSFFATIFFGSRAILLRKFFLALPQKNSPKFIFPEQMTPKPRASWRRKQPKSCVICQVNASSWRNASLGPFPQNYFLRLVLGITPTYTPHSEIKSMAAIPHASTSHKGQACIATSECWQITDSKTGRATQHSPRLAS
jgi:hypothetical protein